MAAWETRLAAAAMVAAAACGVPGTAQASEGGGRPSLSIPIACALGENCWTFQYFDHDPGSGVRDYACGARSYDGHTGTDFALRDAAQIEKGVRVLAAAPGTVRAVRDGMADRLFEPADRAGLKGKDCGNGVALLHGDGWETQYCHLRKGSIRVRPGQKVETGETLGTVGLSGRTQFPHVELVVRHQGEAIDPFTGPAPDTRCGADEKSLWSPGARAELGYSPVDILAVGVTGTMPSADKAKAGLLAASALPSDSPLLAAWATLVGVKEGDSLHLSLTAPDGRVLVSNEDRLRRTQIFYFSFVGDRARSPWPPGDYVARAELVRPGAGAELRRAGETVVRVR